MRLVVKIIDIIVLNLIVSKCLDLLNHKVKDTCCAFFIADAILLLEIALLSMCTNSNSSYNDPPAFMEKENLNAFVQQVVFTTRNLDELKSMCFTLCSVSGSWLTLRIVYFNTSIN